MVTIKRGVEQERHNKVEEMYSKSIDHKSVPSVHKISKKLALLISKCMARSSQVEGGLVDSQGYSYCPR